MGANGPAAGMSARTIRHSRACVLYCRHVASSSGSRRTRIATAIRFPAELHAELQRRAEERDVSVNYLVTRAVHHYLRQLPPADPLPEAVSPKIEEAKLR